MADAVDDTKGRRSVAGILAEVDAQRNGYLTAMKGHEAEARHLLAKIAACDAILASPAAQPGQRDGTDE
jgi:hypothetical protein